MSRRVEGGFWTRRLVQKSKGLSVASTNPADPATEQDLLEWYTTVHIPDVLSTGGFHTSNLDQAIAPVPGLGMYLCLCETGMHTREPLDKFNGWSQWFTDNNRRTNTLKLVKRAQYMRLLPPG